MPDKTVTLPMVEAFMASRSKRLAFPPPLEKLYHERMRSYYLRNMAKIVLPTIIVYNAFLIADYVLLPQTFLLATILHLGVVTPVMLFAAYAYPRLQQQWQREAVAMAMPFMMVAQIMAIFALNRGEAADHYQYLAVMVVIFMNIIQRSGFRIALTSTILLGVTYLGVLLAGPSSYMVKFVGACMMVEAALMSLMANRRMEQDVRFGFLRRLADQLRRESAEAAASRDALTGLANRRRLDETVAALWANADEATSPLAAIMIDIDRFKSFNDRYGHVTGDTCLKRIAGAIASELRNEQDLAVRLGGEEFLMLLPGVDLAGATRIAERVRGHIEKLAIPHEGEGSFGIVTASLGAMASPIERHQFAELLAAADMALYAAKRNGRNQVWPPFVGEGSGLAAMRERRRDYLHVDDDAQAPWTANAGPFRHR